MKNECKGCWCFTQVIEEGLTMRKKDLTSPTFLERHMYMREISLKQENHRNRHISVCQFEVVHFKTRFSLKNIVINEFL